MKAMQFAQKNSSSKAISAEAMLSKYLANPLEGIGSQDLAGIERFKEKLEMEQLKRITLVNGFM